MNQNQEMLLYYCGQLQTEWAQKKALAYLRILTEAGSCTAETRAGGKPLPADRQTEQGCNQKRKRQEGGERKMDGRIIFPDPEEDQPPA